MSAYANKWNGKVAGLAGTDAQQLGDLFCR